MEVMAILLAIAAICLSIVGLANLKKVETKNRELGIELNRITRRLENLAEQLDVEIFDPLEPDDLGVVRFYSREN